MWVRERLLYRWGMNRTAMMVCMPAHQILRARKLAFPDNYFDLNSCSVTHRAVVASITHARGLLRSGLGKSGVDALRGGLVAYRWR
jgi:hypothetical protein